MARCYDARAAEASMLTWVGARADAVLVVIVRLVWLLARRDALGFDADLGRCPSGQRERAVNPSASPTEVRILPGPPHSAAWQFRPATSRSPRRAHPGVRARRERIQRQRDPRRRSDHPQRIRHPHRDPPVVVDRQPELQHASPWNKHRRLVRPSMALEPQHSQASSSLPHQATAIAAAQRVLGDAASCALLAIQRPAL